MHTTQGIKTLDKIEALCDRVRCYQEYGLTDCLQKALPDLRNRYIYTRKKILKEDLKKQKTRVQEVDSVFANTYLSHSAKITLLDRMLCKFPDIVIGCMRLKGKILK